MVMDAGRLSAACTRGAADLVEVFSSVQGEGLRVGERHLFVRFAHCDIHCRYCDTPKCHAVPAAVPLLDRPPGFDSSLVNPVGLGTLEAVVRGYLKRTPHAALSLTGGEPLLQPWALKALSPVARSEGVLVLLETDGNLPDAYAELVDDVDVLSLDWKVASATGEPARPEAHRRFLELVGPRECYVKLVFVEETTDAELIEAAKTLHEVRPETPLVLQPCTPFGRVRSGPSRGRSLAALDLVASIHRPVRLLPQVHRMMQLP